MKHIIIEGHDTSGKSHIAAALSDTLHIPIFKAQRSKYWWDPMVNLLYFTEGITQFIEQTGSHVILDRWHPSDYVYSKMFGRDISYAKIKDIDERLSKLDTLIVYCYKDPSGYIEDAEDFEFVDTSMYSDMTALYQEYSDLSKCKSIFLNTTDQDIKKQLSTILACE